MQQIIIFIFMIEMEIICEWIDNHLVAIPIIWCGQMFTLNLYAEELLLMPIFYKYKIELCYDAINFERIDLSGYKWWLCLTVFVFVAVY